ncbi:VC0807 family protein [Amycolatopsis sp. lyj-346]|uniref:VC0807 family protein n=1 Tax=Amycolatopsis sp. lyj-346 TaxID=2789289 RepID=UPI00397D8DB6
MDIDRSPSATDKEEIERPEETRKNPKKVLFEMLGVDLAAPLGLYYGLRAFGVNQWLAMIVSGLLPLARLGYKLVRYRKVEYLTLFTLSIILCGTVVSLLTGDVRLLLARESYLTGTIGLWITASLLARRPFILSATLPLLPEATARSWREAWVNSPEFRRVMRLMTIAWGGSFLIDAAARIVLAYTLPVDAVPLLSTLVLVVLLVVVVQVSKSYGRRMASRNNTAPLAETTSSQG